MVSDSARRVLSTRSTDNGPESSWQARSRCRALSYMAIDLKHAYYDEQYTKSYHLFYIGHQEENGPQATTIHQADAKLRLKIF